MLLFNGHRGLVWDGKRVLEVNSDAADTRLCLPLQSEVVILGWGIFATTEAFLEGGRFEPKYEVLVRHGSGVTGGSLGQQDGLTVDWHTDDSWVRSLDDITREQVETGQRIQIEPWDAIQPSPSPPSSPSTTVKRPGRGEEPPAQGIRSQGLPPCQLALAPT